MVAALALLGAWSLGGAGTAAAVEQGRGSAGFCPDATGVTVVVDFQDLGGTTIVRCAPGAQSTGLAALKNAGFQIAGTARWGESFVCRIEGKPGADAEKCVNTPPANAYWGYFHASNGGGWKYSDFGVTNRKPPPGSFEGWSFAKDEAAGAIPAPRIAPARPVAAPPPAPRPPAPNQPPAQPPNPAPAPGQAPAVTTRPGAAPPQQAPSVPAPPPVVPSSAPASSAPGGSTRASAVSGSADGVAWTGGEPPAAERGGVPVGTLVAGGVVLVLAAGAGFVVRGRNRARE